MIYSAFMDVLYAIAEPNRQKIVQLLAKKGSLSASEIGQSFKSSAPAISQHLKILREAEVLSVTKQGKERIYSINSKALLQLDDWIKELKTQWQQRLDNLDRVLQKEQKDILDSYNSQLIKKDTSKWKSKK